MKYLVAKPEWNDDEEFEIYERGLNEERPHAWAKMSNPKDMYYEAQILCHNKLGWEFYDTLEDAIGACDKQNGESKT